MKVYSSVLDTIGNTPLIELKKGVDNTKMARIFMKAEYLQPSGSLKDRMALAIVEAAEKDGSLKEGGTIVEATAGNTGLALAMVAAVKGYKSIFVMPDKFSVEKINMLKAFGSTVVTTPTNVPDEHPDSWKEVAKRLVEETPNAILANQFYNLVNVSAHYKTTGPEIWDQTDGKVDCFISGAGSGGTISGVGRYLKEQAKKAGKSVKIVLMDPEGSIYFDTFSKSKPKEKKSWKLEGIGNDFIPGCLDFSYVDEVRKVSDKKAFFYARRLAREQGLFVGDTSGAGVSLALDMARELGPGKIVVCLLCDSGNRYVSKIYNDEWMKSNGFGTLGVSLTDATLGEVIDFKGSEVIFADPDNDIRSVVKLMSENGISQVPVKDPKGNYKMIHESDLLEALLSGELTPQDNAIRVAKPLQGVLKRSDDVSLAEPLLDANNVALVIDDNNEISGIVSRIDLVLFLSDRKK